MKTPKIRIGTRGSRLALAQTEEVKQRIISLFPGFSSGDIEVIPITTTGDRIQDRPLSEIGGKSLFTKEIEEALLDKKIDIAVHSLKDMPPFLPSGLIIGAVLEREDPRDALISGLGRMVSELPSGATLGTSSVRRAAQILSIRPDIEIVPLRGNVTTRLRKMQEENSADATVLAVAGLKRLGVLENIYQPIDASLMLPAVAQGAIGIEVREDNEEMKTIIGRVNHAESNIATTAERAYLGVLEGSCKTPIAALAEIKNGVIALDCLVASLDGRKISRTRREGGVKDAVAIGKDAGEELKSRAKEIF